MGLYDREYVRRPDSGFQMSAPQTATTQLVIITGVVYLAQLFIPGFTERFALSPRWFEKPWTAYTLLTYGFLHSDNSFGSRADIGHILINMLVLWMFGRDVERRYGRGEFIAFYLSAIVVSGLVWSLLEWAAASPAHVVGASGAVSGVVALYALNFPNRRVLFMFVIPMPMWVAAVILVGMDAMGAIKRSGNVACTAHLAGAAFGLFYYYYGWPVGRLATNAYSRFAQRRKPKLRVHDPDDVDEDEDLSRRVDEILAKIQEKGQDSLSWSERRLLERASREYQQKRK